VSILCPLGNCLPEGVCRSGNQTGGSATRISTRANVKKPQGLKMKPESVFERQNSRFVNVRASEIEKALGNFQTYVSVSRIPRLL